MSTFTRRSFIGKTAVAAAGSCRCEGLQTCLSYSLAQDRWLLVLRCLNEMAQRGLFARITTDSFSQLTICLCYALALAQMFSPRIH
jgi:hypothetical protein